MKLKFVFGVLALATLAIASCEKNNGCAKSEKAVVRDLSESDSCNVVFQLEDGNYLEATNLNEFQEWEDADLVWISYKPTSGASECKLGEIVEIRCVVEREF